MPSDSASLIYPVDYSAADCRSPCSSGHSSVVAPDRVVAFGQSTVAVAEPGLLLGTSAGPRAALWRHVGRCWTHEADQGTNARASALGSALWEWAWLRTRSAEN